VTDVERFFRRLVSNLAAIDPARLHHPVPLDQVFREILPYRANRRALQVDTSEDYELVLLRLCAGEEGLVRTEPDEARDRFAQELHSPNPDLDALHAFESVQLTLRPESVARALAAVPETAYSPPGRPARDSGPRPEIVLGSAQFDGLDEPDEAGGPGIEALRGLPLVQGSSDLDQPSGADDPSELEELADVDELPDPETVDSGASQPRCAYCGGSLPVHRPVNFCPHCGQSQTQILCPECRSEVDPGWRHCVNCGAAVGEG
jgi:hypothetical protein